MPDSLRPTPARRSDHRVVIAAIALAAVLVALVFALDLGRMGIAMATLQVLPSVIIIVIALFALVHVAGTRDDLQTRTKDLADVNFALNQSAIVAITDTRGAIKYVNRKFCDISKYSREELIGQDHRILNSGLHPKEFIRTLWVTIANGNIWRGELRNRAKDGSFYWVDTTIVPFLDARGKPYQYMAIRYEITDRKRSEERLAEQEALAHLGQMAAVVAHEVKNPIAGIRGALQIIAARMPAESRDKPIMGDIIARLDALNGIVEDLLVFARPRELRAAPVDLRSLLETTVNLLCRDPAQAGLRVELPTATAIVTGDTEQLQMVFTNVLLNAAHATGGSGHVVMSIGPSPLPGWAVTIADDGPGMPPEVRDQVFEPFFTTKHRGTGLGLPIARRIVEAHGGQIEIDTPASGGTVVKIELPRQS